MYAPLISEQLRLATLERIASYTVGIAVEKNTGIGTGTFVTDGTNHYILTAAHVIDGADIDATRFFIRPNKGLIEKPAIETTNEEVGTMTIGATIPIVETLTDPILDVAILKIDHSFALPEPAEFYPLAKSHDFSIWPEDKLDGISICIFGFPTANARPIKTIGNNTFFFLGVASMFVHYSAELNRTGFSNLPSEVSKKKDFLIEYTSIGMDIHPRGFSGCGVWVATEAQGKGVWSVDPLLIGVIHRYFAKSQFLAATKLPSIVTISRG